MAELGESTDPRALISGDPESLRASAAVMAAFGESLVSAGEGLRGIDDGDWQGNAAEAFHASFDGQPAKWIGCGDSFHAASSALVGYADTLAWAQARSREAIALWQHAEQTSAMARAAHQQHLAQVRLAAAAGFPIPARPFVDPGEPLRAQARDVLASARTQLASAGDNAASAVDAAQEQAPAKPHWWQRAEHAIAHTAGDVIGAGERDVGAVFDSMGNDIATSVGGTLRAVGEDTGAALSDLGGATGQRWLAAAGRDDASTLASAGDVAEDTVRGDVAYVRNELFEWAHEEDDKSAAAVVYVDPSEYPETALHIRQAQEGLSWRGDQQLEKDQPERLTIDRDAEHMNARAKDALRGIPSKGAIGLDRDTYPGAMFSQGGTGASVKYVWGKDSQGAGHAIAAQTRGLANGSDVMVDAE
jgi:hypothetical protein